jgi:hypothetical protein
MPSELSAPTAGMDVNHSFHSFNLDWDDAVRAAAARLDEGWELSDTKCGPQVEEELAAFLCAYGMLGEAVERMDAGCDRRSHSNVEGDLLAGYTKYIER